MREIKFRAWDNILNQWFYFDGLDHIAVYSPAEIRELEHWCEFTGLEDKNGKEIYEGDIVKLYNGKICIINYADKWAKYMLAVPPDGQDCYKYLETYPDKETYTINLEVIGNIYENPELLEASNHRI